MRGRRARTSEGAIPALVLALVWTLGFEVTPLAHAIEHAATPTGTHCHDGTCHDDEDASGISSASHGDGTLAHRDVAATTSPPAIVCWPAFVVAEALDVIELTGPLSAPPASAPSARGPPRA